MTDVPFKLRLLRALTDALKEISPGLSYATELADFDPGDGVAMSRVYRGRLWYGEEDPIPLVSILEGVNPADEVAEPPAATQSGEYDWAIVIQFFVNDDPANPTDPAYFLLADIRRRLLLERKANRNGDAPLLGFRDGKNRLTDIRVGSGVVRPADDVSAKAWGWVPLVLRIVENGSDPYA